MRTVLPSSTLMVLANGFGMDRDTAKTGPLLSKPTVQENGGVMASAIGMMDRPLNPLMASANGGGTAGKSSSHQASSLLRREPSGARQCYPHAELALDVQIFRLASKDSHPNKPLRQQYKNANYPNTLQHRISVGASI